MKFIFIYMVLFFTFFVHAQEKENKDTKLQVQSSLFTASINTTTKLSNKWSLQNKLAISNAFRANTIAFPP